MRSRSEIAEGRRDGSAVGGARVWWVRSMQVSSPCQSIALLPLPEACPQCHAVVMIGLETTVQGGAVYLSWCCRNCSYEWPVTNAEHRISSGGKANGTAAGSRVRIVVTREQCLLDTAPSSYGGSKGAQELCRRMQNARTFPTTNTRITRFRRRVKIGSGWGEIRRHLDERGGGLQHRRISDPKPEEHQSRSAVDSVIE
jgi:hypothetical protein